MSSDIIKIKPNELRSLIGLNVMSNGKHNELIIGAPGDGKTSSLFDYSKVNNRALYYVNCPKCSKEKLEPIPVRNPNGSNDEDFLKLYLPEIARFSNANPNGMIIMDELGASSVAQQCILLSLIQERKGWGYDISKDISIFALSNDTDCLGNRGFISAMSDRFSILLLNFTYSDISEMFLLDFKYDSLDDMISNNDSSNNTIREISESRQKNLIIVDNVMKSYPKFINNYRNTELLNSVDLNIVRSYLSNRTLTKVVDVLDSYDKAVSDPELCKKYKVNLNSYWQLIAGIAGEEFTSAILKLKLESKLNILNFEPDKWNGEFESIKMYVDDTYSRNYLITQQMIYLNSNLSRVNIENTIKLINYICNYNHLYGDYIGENSYNYRFAKKIVELNTNSKILKNKLSVKEIQDMFDIYRLGSTEEKMMLV